MSSVAFDKIVPLGQDFVLDDMPLTLTLKEWVAFFLCLIDVSVDSRKYCESRFCGRFGSHVTGLFDGVEDGSTPNSGNLREEPVLYGVPLGAVRRIVGYPDVDAQFLGRFHETPFELPASSIVGTSSVTKDTDTLCTWIYMTEVLLPLLYKAVAGKLRCVVAYSESHVASVPVDIIDAMRYHLAVGERGIVMVVHLDGFSAISCSVVTSERAEDFLLLGVHAQQGSTRLLTPFPQLFNNFELLVAPLAISHRQGLYRLAPCVPLIPYDLSDGIEAYLYMVLLREYLLDLRGSQPKPFRVGILRKSCYIELYDFAEDGDILGMLGERALPASSLFADSALFEVLSCLKLLATSVDGITGNGENATDKTYTMPAKPICYDSDKLSCLSLVCVSEVLHFLVCYYICWIIRDPHNCLKFSYKGTNFSADSKI